MSIEALNFAFGLHPDWLDGVTRSVLVVLADHADETLSCHPSLERIQKRTSWSERAVRKSLRKLEQMGLVISQQRFRKTTHFTLVLQKRFLEAPEGALSAPLSEPADVIVQEPFREQQTSRIEAPTVPKGAPDAPLPEGGISCRSRGHHVPLRGAPHAPEPPMNHQRTLRGAGERASQAPRPLTEDWLPSLEDRVHARILGLDPDAVGQRFRDHFLASGKPLADVAARWRQWCAEDLQRRGKPRPRITPGIAAPAVTGEGPELMLTAVERRMLDRWSVRRAAGDHLGQFEEDLERQLSRAALAELHRRQDAAGPTEADQGWLQRWAAAEGQVRTTLAYRLPTLLSRPGMALWRQQQQGQEHRSPTDNVVRLVRQG